MIKLADLLEFDLGYNVQPSEKSKLKNYLYSRGSKDQIAQTQQADEDNLLKPNRYNRVGSKPGVAGEGKGMLDTSGHPEDHNTSQRYNNGYPWSWEEPSLFEDQNPSEEIRRALIGREFQTLDDLAKLVSRLRQAGFAQSDIEQFVINHIL